MARVKNITREPEKKVPSALFRGVVGTNRKRILKCDGCGLMLHRSNLAKHQKRCRQRRDATEGIRMKIKLPGMTKALEDKVPGEEECQSPDLSHLPPTPEAPTPLVLGEVPKEGAAGPPSSPTSPADPEEGSVDLSSTATPSGERSRHHHSIHHIQVRGKGTANHSAACRGDMGNQHFSM